MTSTSVETLIEQLRALLALTQTEAQIARVRVGQARTDAVRRELSENADNADQRSRAIADTLRTLGGYPDVVTPAVGRISALIKANLEQVEPLAEALLSDLQLEHQLVDRARYLKVLAKTADRADVGRLADRLIEAHSATVDWLGTVLAEDALGGPAALVSSPLQRAAGVATRVVNLPVRTTASSVNRYVSSVQRNTEQTVAKATQLGQRAAGFVDGAREVLVSGRDASLKRAERLARRDGNRDGAAAVHETRRDLGALDSAELPIKNYDSLATTAAVTAIKKLTEADDVRAVIAYEEAHKARSSVVSAAQTQVAAIAKQVAGISS